MLVIMEAVSTPLAKPVKVTGPVLELEEPLLLVVPVVEVKLLFVLEPTPSVDMGYLQYQGAKL
jgi:hypothetical protein